MISEYELAQKRIQIRERKRNRFIIWLGVFVGLLLLIAISASEALFCMWPLVLLPGLICVAAGIDWFFSRNNQQPPAEMVEQEMAFLFGSDWHENTGMQEYAFAQERVRARQRGPWNFALHSLFFLPVSLWLLGVGARWLDGIVILPLIWALFYIRHGMYVFPTSAALARRERRAGEAIRRELELLTPEKHKNEEKPKRAYALGDDGEIVELTDEDVADEPDRSEKGRLT
jgi:hypothetical protein